MREKIVATGLPLCPVTSVVDTDQTEWARHADNDTQIDQDSFDCLRTVISAMDQLSMQSDGVAQQERRIRRDQEHDNRGTRCREKCAADEAHKTSIDPKGLTCRPDDSALNGVCP
jgi:hypothetical protein